MFLMSCGRKIKSCCREAGSGGAGSGGSGGGEKEKESKEHDFFFHFCVKCDHWLLEGCCGSGGGCAVVVVWRCE